MTRFAVSSILWLLYFQCTPFRLVWGPEQKGMFWPTPKEQDSPSHPICFSFLQPLAQCSSYAPDSLILSPWEYFWTLISSFIYVLSLKVFIFRSICKEGVFVSFYFVFAALLEFFKSLRFFTWYEFVTKFKCFSG